MAISGELLDPDMLEGGTRVFSALAAIWEEGQVLSGGISYLPLTRVFQLMAEEHRAEESEVCWAWEMGRIAALLCTGTDPGLERSSALHGKEPWWASGWRWSKWENNRAADSGAATECPQEAVSMEVIMTTERFLSRHLCRGSCQSLALFKDPNPIRLEMTRIQQTVIVRKTYFQIFAVTQ